MRKNVLPLNGAFAIRATARPKNGLKRHREKGEDQSIPNRTPPVRIGEDKRVIVEATKACRGNPVKLVLHEGVNDNLSERKADHQQHHEHRRHDQIPR